LHFESEIKELSHSILSNVGHVQNYFLIEGNVNLKIVIYKNRKTREIAINHKPLVKDG